ncbi:MAG: hypothetical protein A2252_02565 [Elusimicrobia bacterium RIFOXYA2_FULL_39_19]|nr:MAG: hypothetical protein A2252_02565 [Elusimicrobia bacterium RIFOXYA2_FULL_39_19]
MNKENLVLSLTKVLSTKREAKMALEHLFATIKESLKSGEKVIVSGFGSFNITIHRAKKIKNPKTGKIILISPRKKVKFKPAVNLLD